MSGIAIMVGGAFLGWVGNALLKSRDTSGKLTAHEDICAERYRRIEQAHANLVKVTDERHKETGERFDRVDDKLDQLLAR